MTVLHTTSDGSVQTLESIWLSTKHVTDYCQNGVRWAVVHETGATPPNLKFKYSLDGLAYTHVPAMNLQAFFPNYPFGIFVDKDDYMWVWYMKYDPSAGGAQCRFAFRRGTPNTARTSYTWGAENIVTVCNTSAPDMKMVVHRYGSGWKAHVVYGGAGLTTQWLLYDVSSSGTITQVTGAALQTNNGRSFDIDFHHTQADPKAVLGTDPHLYIIQDDPVWNGSSYVTTILPIKMVHSAGVWTASNGLLHGMGYGNSYTYGTLNAYWDGTRVVGSMAQTETPGAGSEIAGMYVFEWAGAPGTNVDLLPLSGPYVHSAALSGFGVAYNRANQDIYHMILDEAGKVFKRVYSRTGGAWAAAVEVLTVAGFSEAAGGGEESFASFTRYDSPTDSQIWMVALGNTTYPWNYVVESVQTFNLPPIEPEPQYPADNAYLPIAGAWNLLFKHRDPNPSDNCHSWQLRRRIGSGAWSYWNVGTAAWQAGEVWNNAATPFDIVVAFGAGKWANGTTYGWQARTRDALLTVGAWMAEDFFTGSLAPTVDVTAPAGIVTVTQSPTVIWTYADAEGHPCLKYRVKVFSAAEYGAGGFDPETSASTWDSGEKAGSSVSQAVTTELDNGGSYRAYVKAAQAGDQWSAWDYLDFSLVMDPPAQCVVTQTPAPSSGKVSVTVQCRENMLSANTASIETSAAGWVAGASTTATRVTAQAKNGSASLRLTRTGTLGSATALTPTGVAGVPVVAGKQYTALASFRAVTTGRNCRVNISWYTAAGALIASTNGNQVADSSANFNAQSVCTAVAPPTSAFATLTVEVLSAAVNEQHYVDAISLAPGNSAVWTRGGANPSVEIQRKVGTGSWETVRNGQAVLVSSLADQVVVYDDYEVPFGVTVNYRARTLIEV